MHNIDEDDYQFTEDTFFSNQGYSDKFEDAEFTQPEEPNTEFDTDGDGIRTGVDASEFEVLDEVVKGDLLDEARADHADAYFDHMSPSAADTITGTVVEQAASRGFGHPVAGVMIGVHQNHEDNQQWDEKDACFDNQEEILDSTNDYDRERSIEEFEANSCNETITPVVSDFRQLEECIDESSSREEVNQCMSDNYGDSDNDDIPTAVDSSEKEPNIEYSGDTTGLIESGSEAHAQYYDIEGNDYFSTDPLDQPAEVDEPYCETDDQMSMFEQEQLYSAEANLFMAQHTEDPQIASQYAVLASQNLEAVPSEEVAADLEYSIEEASGVADELDYSYERSNISYNENTDEEYSPDLTAIDQSFDIDFGESENSDSFDDSIDNFADTSGDTMDIGSSYDSGGASGFDDNSNNC